MLHPTDAAVLRLRCDLAFLRLQVKFVAAAHRATQTAWLARKFDPGQLRVPKGEPEGGQWAKVEVELTQNRRPPRGGSRRDRPGGGGRPPTVSPIGALRAAEEIQRERRLRESDAQRESAVQRVRDLDPGWTPRTVPSTGATPYERVVANERIVRESEARLQDLYRTPIYDILVPDGQRIGYHLGSAREDIRTLDAPDFERLEQRLRAGASVERPEPSSGGYKGHEIWTRLDGSRFGIRDSDPHGRTIDIFGRRRDGPSVNRIHRQD